MARLAWMITLVLLGGGSEALAGGKKEGAGESGGGAVAPIASTASGPREKMIEPERVGDKLGTLKLEANMLAGAGAGKCRMNFVLFNGSTATVALGMLGTSVSAKGEVLDNWVINVGGMAPGTQTARLFSCGIGAAQLVLSPLGDFGNPPIKCHNATQELESCAVALQIRSSLPMLDRDKIPKPADGKDKEKKH